MRALLERLEEGLSGGTAVAVNSMVSFSRTVFLPGTPFKVYSTRRRFTRPPAGSPRVLLDICTVGEAFTSSLSLAVTSAEGPLGRSP